MKKFLMIILSFSLIASAQDQSPWASLGWVADQSTCQGHFRPLPELKKRKDLHIESHKPVKLKATESQWESITFHAPSLQLTTHHLTLNSKEHSARAWGHVAVQKGPHKMIAKEVLWSKDALNIDHAHYRIHFPSIQQTVWGRAKKIINRGPIWSLRSATYSSCHTQHPSWWIYAHRIQLDQKNHQAKLQHGLLMWHRLPIFYWPYLKFPIDETRHTGFLYPHISNDQHNGLSVGFPFYWNIRPNQDMTLTGRLTSKNHSNYLLTWRHINAWDVFHFSGFLHPNDRVFQSFIDHQSTSISAPMTPGEQLLLRSHTKRWWLNTKGIFAPQPNLNLSFHIHQRSDAYINNDFGFIERGLDPYHDLWSTHLGWKSTYWKLDVFGQSLPMRPMLATPMHKSLMSRSPQITWTIQPHLSQDMDFTLPLQWGHYRPSDDLISTRDHFDRWLLHPQIHYQPHQGPIRLNMSYFAVGYSNPNTHTLVPSFSASYQQSFLAPRTLVTTRLHAHYLPYRAQSQHPIVDTTSPWFRLENLRLDNRFSGPDRIGDAHDIISELMVDTLDRQGRPWLHSEVGMAYAWHKHQVCDDSLCLNDPLHAYHLSPLSLRIAYHPALSPISAIYNSLQFKRPYQQHHLNLFYSLDPSHQWSLGFHRAYRVNEAAHIQRFNLINFGLSEHLTPNLSLSGHWQWFASEHKMGYNLALGYQSCCWTLHVGLESRYNDISRHKSKVNARWFVQIQLNGLGHIGHLPGT